MPGPRSLSPVAKRTSKRDSAAGDGSARLDRSSCPPMPGHRLLRPIRGVFLLLLFVVTTIEMTVFFFLPLALLQPLVPSFTFFLYRRQLIRQ